MMDQSVAQISEPQKKNNDFMKKLFPIAIILMLASAILIVAFGPPSDPYEPVIKVTQALKAQGTFDELSKQGITYVKQDRSLMMGWVTRVEYQDGRKNMFTSTTPYKDEFILRKEDGQWNYKGYEPRDTDTKEEFLRPIITTVFSIAAHEAELKSQKEKAAASWKNDTKQ